MAGLFQIGLSGITSYYRAINITSNNIGNVGNKAYSRQIAHFSTLPSQRAGTSFLGSGVMLNGTQRMSSSFAVRQVRETTSIKSQYDAFFQQASQIDKLLSQEGSSVSAGLQGFFNALSQINDTPGNTAARTALLKQAEVLVSHFNNLQNRLDDIQHNSTAQLTQSVNQVNALARQLANLNSKLLGDPDAPELLDQRDELLRQLSEFADVSVGLEASGAATVSIGSGQVLVLGAEQRDLSVSVNPTGRSNSEILINNGTGQIDITNRIHSGKIGGALDFEKNVVKEADRLLGKMAIGLSQAFNAQHQLGVDLNGQFGKAFFTDFNQALLQQNRVAANSANAGTANLTVGISDINQLSASDYDVVVTDALTNEVQITRRVDGQVTTVNFTSTPPTPPAGQITLDGLTITADDLGNLANLDRFVLSPTKGAAGQLGLNIADAREVAVAAPVRVQEANANSGTGNIRLKDVFNTTNTTKSFRIEFISPTQYNIVNETDVVTTGPFAFTPNAENTIMIPDSVSPSYSVVLSGIPVTGDQFTASFNSGGVGDNWNGVKLAAIAQEKVFSSGTESLFDSYANILVEVGSKTNQAKLSGAAADVLFQQAVDFRDSESAVNLDEEGMNLLRFQEAYQASAQVLTVANNLINVLFDAMR